MTVNLTPRQWDFVLDVLEAMQEIDKEQGDDRDVETSKEVVWEITTQTETQRP